MSEEQNIHNQGSNDWAPADLLKNIKVGSIGREEIPREVPEEKNIPSETFSPQESAEKIEQTEEQKQEQEVQEKEETQPLPRTSSTQVTAHLVQQSPKDEVLQEVEGILSEGLSEIYQSLDQKKQQEFQKLGEETAIKVQKILHQVKIKAKEILKLIRSWLEVIPGVNTFFLEQEAKIKTDQIMDLAVRIRKEKIYKE